ncbi:MAG TPA: hypothetical protein VLU96_00705 [Gaiellaceae bacterium]|nr:hypothetical protein [Gaiellaceae bacterium]
MRQIVVLGVLVGAAVVLALGLRTGSEAASTNATKRVFTGRVGDVFRVPAISVRCIVSREGGAPDLICQHTPRWRYQVVHPKDNLFVYRSGRPDDPVFSAKGRP